MMMNVRRWSSALAIMLLATACSSGGSKSSSNHSISAQTVAPTSDTTPLGGLHISSRIFANGDKLPRQYTCDGRGAIPQMQFSGIPDGTRQLRLVVHDPDAPVKGGVTHWTVTNIPPTTESMPPVPAGAKEVVKWRPPCPPKGSAPHHYKFMLTALSSPDLVLGQATLVGTYGR
jgi:Raf kinase inhibitor-like YbhB/YbcL family protein